MNFKRLLTTEMGKFFISVLLGLGIATLFRQVCTGDKCLTFNGPVISDIDDKIFKQDEKCYKYTTRPAKCDPIKRVIEVSAPPPESESVKPGLF
jgi:hypothetical protein